MKLKTLTWGLAIALGCVLGSCQKGEFDLSQPGKLVPKTVDQDPSLPAIELNGTRFHAEAFGHPDSPLLVVLHGGPGADYRYLLNCKAFADDDFRVVFYDQRGAGLSKRHPKDSYTIQQVLDDLTAIIEHYQRSPEQKVFLLGHSWGGMLATAYINDHPTKINGAILAEPGGFTYAQMNEYLSRSQSYSPFSESLNDAVYFDQFITGKADEHEILDYKFGLWAAAENGQDSPVGNEGPLESWRAGAVVFDALFSLAQNDGFDWTTHLLQYSTKILFVYSENNTAYGESHAQKVSAAYPNVQMFRTDDAGHDMISFPKGWQHFYPVALNYLNSLK
jgi:proline iminopeptidase